MKEIRVVADGPALAREAATEFCRIAERSVSARGAFRVALSGGSTPRALYRLLGGDGDPSFRGRVPWERAHFHFTDERRVSPDHEQSNYRMAYEAMLGRAPVPPGHVQRVWSEGPDVAVVAAYYESMIRDSFGLSEGGVPRFDLVLLGMGADGHTASLFPRSEALKETTRLVAAPWVEHLGAHRYTLTPPVLNHAGRVIFLVEGAGKAETLRRVLEGALEPDLYPAQIVRPADGALLWIVDRAAASLLAHAG